MPTSAKRSGLTRLSYLLALVIAAVSAAWVYQLLSDFPDPPGANGYFYLKQTESLASGSGFYFKDRSLAFALPVLLQKILGDSLVSFRLSIVAVWLGGVAACIHLFWVLSRSAPDPKRALGVVLVALGVACTTQAYELYLTFFKNAFALTLTLWGLAVLLGSTSHRSKILGGALLLGALLSHKSMLLILGCIGLMAALDQFRQRGSLKLALVVGAAGSAAVALFLYQFERSAAYLKALLSSFASAGPWIQWVLHLKNWNLEMLLTLVFLAAAALTYLLCRKYIEQRVRPFLDAMVLIFVFALQPFQLPGANGPAYRVLLLAPMFAVVLLVSAWLSVRRAIFVWAIPALLGILLVQPLLHTRHLEDVFTPFAVLEEDVALITKHVTPADHLTSHHGMEFFIDYKTGIRSRSFLNEDPAKKDFRIAYVGLSWLRNQDAQDALHGAALLDIGSEYVLLKEADWQRLSKEFALPKHWKNPFERRPAFISDY